MILTKIFTYLARNIKSFTDWILSYLKVKKKTSSDVST